MTTQYGGSGDPARSMALLWGMQRRPTRGPKPRFTVDGITAVAIELADTEGLDALSMRKVAERLGTTAMALYSYVPGKAELLDLMVDRVHGELPAGPYAGDGWRAKLERLARELWAMHLRHPWLLQIARSRPVLGPNIMAAWDRQLGAVADLGLTEIEMDLVVTMVIDYVHGAVRTAVEMAQAAERTGVTDQQWWEAHAPLLEKVYDPRRFPHATRVGAATGEEYQAPAAPERAFEFGLARLLDGLAAFLTARTG